MLLTLWDPKADLTESAWLGSSNNDGRRFTKTVSQELKCEKVVKRDTGKNRPTGEPITYHEKCGAPAAIYKLK